jgi:hypothetical protein
MTLKIRHHVFGLLFALLGFPLALLSVVILEIGYFCGAFEEAKNRKTWMWVLGAFLIVYHCSWPVPLVSNAHMVNLELLTGWGNFLARSIPAMTWEPIPCILGACSLIAFVIGTEFMGRAFVRQSSTENEQRLVWKSRWSAGIVAAVALMFVSGMAAAGIMASAESLWELR